MPRVRFSYYDSLKILLGVACVALSLGWGKFLGKTVFLPFYPDAIDVVLGIIVGSFLIFDYAKHTGFLASPRRVQSSSVSS